MKQRLILCCIFSFAVGKLLHSQDQLLNFGIDFRTDYDTRINNHQRDVSDIRLQTLSLLFFGELYPGITYCLEEKLNNTGPLTVDEYMGSTANAWINFAPRNWKWSFTVGKQDIMFGSFESDYDPSDLYLTSMVFDNFTRSQVGVAANYYNRNHVLSMQISNLTGKQLSYDDNHSFGYTVNGRGNYFKGTILASLSYTLVQSGYGHIFHWASLGTQIRTGNFFTEIDAYAGRYRQNMTIDSSQDNYREADNLSISISESFRFGKLRPFIKIAANWQEDVETNTLSRRSYGGAAGIEYYPIRGEDFRIHLVYQHHRNRYGEMWLDREGTEKINIITAGMKWKLTIGSLVTKAKNLITGQ